MIFETSWDDYHPLNMKLAQLLKKYALPAVFYLEASNKKSLEQAKVLSQLGFGIGSHTLTHPQDLKRLDQGALSDEIYLSKVKLGEKIGKTIKSFCYPRGRFNLKIAKMVEEAGYEEARTVKVLETNKKYHSYEKPTTIHFFNRKEYKGEPILKIAKRYFRKAKAEDSYFHLWGHSWELERHNLWGKLEEFLKYATNK